jgi:hypothetical protein
MKSNLVRMTLTNESVTFYRDCIWIQPLLSDGFKFAGSPAELMSIMIYHLDLDINNCQFRVRDRNLDFYVSPSTIGY